MLQYITCSSPRPPTVISQYSTSEFYLTYQFWSFRGDRIPRNFLWQTAASGSEVFVTFRTNSTPSSGCAGGHQLWCHQTTSSPWRWDGVSSRDLGKPSHPSAVVCPRKFHLRQMFVNAVRLCISPHLIVIILPISFHFSHRSYAK